MLLQRNHYYESASDFFIQTDGLTPAEITRKIIERIGE
jgi:hypothetical protein